MLKQIWMSWAIDSFDKKKWKDAVAVLQVNVDNYPDSYNVYDSLGEAQLLNEEADKAFENYQKSEKHIN